MTSGRHSHCTLKFLHDSYSSSRARLTRLIYNASHFSSSLQKTLKKGLLHCFCPCHVLAMGWEQILFLSCISWHIQKQKVFLKRRKTTNEPKPKTKQRKKKHAKQTPMLYASWQNISYFAVFKAGYLQISHSSSVDSVFFLSVHTYHWVVEIWLLMVCTTRK